eukprot:UN00480
MTEVHGVSKSKIGIMFACLAVSFGLGTAVISPRIKFLDDSTKGAVSHILFGLTIGSLGF